MSNEHTNATHASRRLAKLASDVTALCVELRRLADGVRLKQDFDAALPAAAAMLKRIESLAARERLAITPLPERAGREHEARQRKGRAA